MKILKAIKLVGRAEMGVTQKTKFQLHKIEKRYSQQTLLENARENKEFINNLMAKEYRGRGSRNRIPYESTHKHRIVLLQLNTSHKLKEHQKSDEGGTFRENRIVYLFNKITHSTIILSVSQ